MSYAAGVIVCAVDNSFVRFGEVPPDVAWDMHRGVQVPPEQRVVERAAQATDAEVEEFMRWLEKGDDGLPPTLSRAVSYGVDHATGSVDTGLEFLATVRELQARCTCETTLVTQCPNWVPGDEDEGDDE